MASVNYQVLSFDLAIARAEPGVAILTPGIVYDGVTVLAIPVGATCALAFGDNKQPIPLTQAGASYNFLDKCGNPYGVDEALRLSNPVGGGTLTLLVSIGSGAGDVQTNL